MFGIVLKMLPIHVDISSNEPLYYLFTVSVNKCGGRCNTICSSICSR